MDFNLSAILSRIPTFYQNQTWDLRNKWASYFRVCKLLCTSGVCRAWGNDELRTGLGDSKERRASFSQGSEVAPQETSFTPSPSPLSFVQATGNERIWGKQRRRNAGMQADDVKVGGVMDGGAPLLLPACMFLRTFERARTLPARSRWKEMRWWTRSILCRFSSGSA